MSKVPAAACEKRDRKLLQRMLVERSRGHKQELKSLKKLVDERDRYYVQQFKNSEQAVKDALTANKEQTSAAFAASKEAINKAEEAQRSYNQTHNDLTRKMDAQYKEMVPASEARLKWESVDKEVTDTRREMALIRESLPREVSSLRSELMKEIQGLRESRSEGGGRESVRHDYRERQQWSTGIVVAVLLALVSMAISVYLGTRTATVPVIYNTPSSPVTGAAK